MNGEMAAESRPSGATGVTARAADAAGETLARLRVNGLVSLQLLFVKYRKGLADASRRATDKELFVMRDLEERGLDAEGLRVMLGGGHVVIDDPELYERWVFPDSDQRLSSHHREMDKKQYPDYGMVGPFVRQSLMAARLRAPGSSGSARRRRSSSGSTSDGAISCTSRTSSCTGSRARTLGRGASATPPTNIRCTCNHGYQWRSHSRRMSRKPSSRRCAPRPVSTSAPRPIRSTDSSPRHGSRVSQTLTSNPTAAAPARSAALPSAVRRVHIPGIREGLRSARLQKPADAGTTQEAH